MEIDALTQNQPTGALHASAPAPEPETDPCEVCGARAWSTAFETGDRRFGLPGRFAVLRCESCGVGRTNPVPEDLGAHYPSDEYYSYAPPQPPSALGRARVRRAYGLKAESHRARLLGRLWARRLTPGLPPGPPGDVLDVGCGSGQTLLALREAGWRVNGLEIDGSAVGAARAAGLDSVRQGDLLSAGYPDERFDVVRFWHVLEHLSSPREQLQEARRILRPGGALVVGVPNFASLLSRRAGDRWFYLDVPRHLWHFTPGSLRALTSECGFDVDELRLLSTPTPIAETAAIIAPSTARVTRARGAWMALLPVAAFLDRLGLGDAIELHARRRA
jgi:SAM-dependent methyltransferase